MSHSRLGWLVAAVLLAACAAEPGTSSPAASGSVAGTTATSPTATSPTAKDPTATDSPTSSAAAPSTSTTMPVDATAQYTVGALPATGGCHLDPPSADGQITFVVGNRLYGIASNAIPQCLADLKSRSPDWLSWSPDGDELLAGPDMLLRANGTMTTTGYFADNTNVRWSAPTGKALLAPKASTGQLIWRNAHNSAERIDVSFADNITSAAYHPAGKHIAVAGIGRDGQGPGVFVASNRGANAQRIGQLEPGTTATDVAFEMEGNSIVFVHAHQNGGAHLHRWDFANGLQTLADLPGVTPTDLTVSQVDQGDIAWTQSYPTVKSISRVLVNGSTEPLVIGVPEAERVTAPIGWMPGHRLLVSSRSPDRGASPFDIWEWSPTGMRLVIAGVTAAAARLIHGHYDELTIIPGAGFG